jgi:hypothetical protein
MHKVFAVAPREIEPTRDEVLAGQGIPADGPVSGRIEELLAAALDLYAKRAAPAAMFSEISKEDFKAVFEGKGRNEPDAPLGSIYPEAVRLALFAATLGEEICAAIRDLFASNHFALGSMLDSVASAAADRAAAHLEERYARYLAAAGESGPGTRTLAYSPGYCGWDMSAQENLFGALKPEEIGITLGASFLMTPIKSVSGVLVSGPAEIHRFVPDYPFCRACRARSCHARMEATERRWRS